MPEIFSSNKYWTRGGKLSQKRHIEMTEDEKAAVVKCDGIKSNHPCKNPTFRCKACGNFGCAQEVLDKCSKQGFKNDKCLQCGVVGSRVPIMEDEYDKVKNDWEVCDI